MTSDGSGAGVTPFSSPESEEVSVWCLDSVLPTLLSDTLTSVAGCYLKTGLITFQKRG